MSTLADIASAAERLPPDEQRELIQQLSSKLPTHPPAVDRAAREAWVARLEKAAKAGSTGRHSITVDQIIDELREERI